MCQSGSTYMVVSTEGTAMLACSTRRSVRRPAFAGRWFISALVLLAATTVVSGGRAMASEKTSRPELLESGVFKLTLDLGDIFWLDNDRVVFAGQGTRMPASEEELSQLPEQLYLWELGKPAREYPAKRRGESFDKKSFGFYCAGKGNIYYGGRRVDGQKGQETWYVGPPGKEVLTTFSPPGLRDAVKGFAWNDVGAYPFGPSCEPRRVDLMAGRYWLRDDDGSHALDFGPHGKQRGPTEFHVGLIDFQKRLRIRLPFTLLQTSVRCALHDRFNDRFVIWDCSDPWPKDRCYPVWFIDESTSKISQICIAAGPWAKRHNKIVIAKDGQYVLVPMPWNAEHDAVSGLYRLQGGNLVQILVGMIGSLAVSPDGCKMAFSHLRSPKDFKYGGDIFPMVKAIDVCASSGN